MNDITGIILAGGLAKRMGGDDKGLIALAGKPLVQYAVERLQPQVAALIINANRHHSRYARYAPRVVGDIIQDYAGPLAGIHAGMCAAATDWVLTAPCDCPFLPADLAVRLLQAAGEQNAQVAVAAGGGRAHPVFMLAQRRLADDIAATLASGEGKIDRWYARLPHVVVEFPDAAVFDNINTRQQLLQAEAAITK